MKRDNIRNPFAIAAKKRHAGKIRPRTDKRSNGKNVQRQLLTENDCVVEDSFVMDIDPDDLAAMDEADRVDDEKYQDACDPQEIIYDSE